MLTEHEEEEFIRRIRERLGSASMGDRMYERPMTWDEADRLLAIVDRLQGRKPAPDEVG